MISRKEIESPVEIASAHREMIRVYLQRNWGSSHSVSLGHLVDASKLPGFMYLADDTISALVTFQIVDQSCEIVTLNSEIENSGYATELMKKVVSVAMKERCERVWLITTNDNTHAIRFYQKRGFDWVAFHRNSMVKSRKIKPEIPRYGVDAIPIDHEVEFELRLSGREEKTFRTYLQD